MAPTDTKESELRSQLPRILYLEDFIQKPFSADVLAIRVRHVLDAG